jgi:pimeloyl-ACP methyl ester carboxylesterase
MPTVKANGCEFYYEVDGQGQDVIFVHGEIHGLEYWEGQIPDFSKDYRCFRYNRRGHARTSWTEYGFSLVNQTRDLEQFIEVLGIERPIIIAVAFGTTIAAHYAIKNPDKVAGLVLVAWSELHDAYQYFERWAGYNAISARVLEQEGRDALVSLLQKEGGRTIYMVIPVDSPVRDKVIRMFAGHPLGEYQRGMLEFAASVPDLIPAFKQLDVPVLGICGTQDPYPDQPQILEGMKNFREADAVEGGRFAHWERPEAFNGVLRSFFASIK